MTRRRYRIGRFLFRLATGIDLDVALGFKMLREASSLPDLCDNCDAEATAWSAEGDALCSSCGAPGWRCMDCGWTGQDEVRALRRVCGDVRKFSCPRCPGGVVRSVRE